MVKVVEKYSYAKINLYLRVLGHREDGYHNLDTIFQEIDLADHMVFSFTNDQLSLISLICEASPCALEDNLVYKAAKLFLKTFACNFSVAIQLSKHIPVGAGLGGGSSNAASTLLALADYAGVAHAQLIPLAKRLGADVSFFLFGGTARGEGRGDKILPMPSLQGFEYVIVCPDVHVSTAKVFRALKESLTQKANHDIKQGNFFSPKLLESEEFTNDLEEVTFGLYPELRKAKQQLEKLTSYPVRMSGSGAAFFIECPNSSEGQKILDLVGHQGYVGFISKRVFRNVGEGKERGCGNN